MGEGLLGLVDFKAIKVYLWTYRYKIDYYTILGYSNLCYSLALIYWPFIKRSPFTFKNSYL